MASSVVRLDESTHAKLRKVSQDEHRSMGEIVAELVERYQKEQFWKDVNASLERLRADPAAWQDYQDEIALWESTSMDGLENEPPYYTPEEEAEIEAEHARTT